MLRGHPGFCRKSHSPFPIKNPTETAHVSAKASAKTEGNGSCPLLREHQSNFWNWRYSYHRVLWLSLLIARLSATLYCQSGTDDLHSAALFQVILFFERRHSTEWPSISQLRIQVSSQQILDVVFGDDLVACLWAGSGERREAISALDPAEGMSWLPGSMPDPSARGKDNSLFMHRCNFCYWLDTPGRVFWGLSHFLGDWSPRATWGMW